MNNQLEVYNMEDTYERSISGEITKDDALSW
jgi:hypothetical protein